MERMLDVGCGDGWSLTLAGACACKFCVGVDIDPVALQEGKRKLPWAEFVVARGEALPFKDASFDHVICRVALPYMPALPALAEMRRVSTLSAAVSLNLHDLRFAFHDLAQSFPRRSTRFAVGRIWALVNGVMFVATGRNYKMPFTRRDHGWDFWQTKGSISRALRRVGFERVETPFVVNSEVARRAASETVVPASSTKAAV